MDQFTERIQAYLDSDASPSPETVKFVTDPIVRTVRENPESPQDLRFDLFWDAFILLAKNQLTIDDAAKIIRLVDLVDDIKASGYIMIEDSPVKTALGSPWTDVPYLGAQMREAWNQAPPVLSAEQWANLNQFAARLTWRGTIDLSLYAIWSLRDALEAPRPLTERQTGEGDKQAQNASEVSVDELLPGALEWITTCAEMLADLSYAKKSYKDPNKPGPDPAFLGKMAKDAGLEETGFNEARWRFWQKRLAEVSQAKDDAGGREKVAKLAYQGLQSMTTANSRFH